MQYDVSEDRGWWQSSGGGKLTWVAYCYICISIDIAFVHITAAVHANICVLRHCCCSLIDCLRMESRDLLLLYVFET